MSKIHFFTPADNIPPKKSAYRLSNWPEYNKALVQRGAITLWLDEQTLAQWYHQGPHSPGGVLRYSDRCLEAALALKAILGLAFRQTQGLIQSVLKTMKLTLQTPSYSQLCRRQARQTPFAGLPSPPFMKAEPIHIVVDSTGLKVFGEGEWRVRQHGAAKRRTWRKLHLALDEATNEIHAVELTTNAVSDAQMIKPLVAGIQPPIAKLGGDGAYDQVKVYDELVERGIQPLIPPRLNAVVWTDEAGSDLVHPRNAVLSQIDAVGLAGWKQQRGYHRRSKAETAMFRWKTTFSERLATRLLSHQQTEARIKASCLNRFTELGMPKSVRRDSTSPCNKASISSKAGRTIQLDLELDMAHE